MHQENRKHSFNLSFDSCSLNRGTCPELCGAPSSAPIFLRLQKRRWPLKTRMPTAPYVASWEKPLTFKPDLKAARRLPKRPYSSYLPPPPSDARRRNDPNRADEYVAREGDLSPAAVAAGFGQTLGNASKREPPRAPSRPGSRDRYSRREPWPYALQSERPGFATEYGADGRPLSSSRGGSRDGRLSKKEQAQRAERIKFERQFKDAVLDDRNQELRRLDPIEWKRQRQQMQELGVDKAVRERERDVRYREAGDFPNSPVRRGVGGRPASGGSVIHGGHQVYYNDGVTVREGTTKRADKFAYLVYGDEQEEEAELAERRRREERYRERFGTQSGRAGSSRGRRVPSRHDPNVLVVDEDGDEAYNEAATTTSTRAGGTTGGTYYYSNSTHTGKVGALSPTRQQYHRRREKEFPTRDVLFHESPRGTTSGARVGSPTRRDNDKKELQRKQQHGRREDESSSEDSSTDRPRSNSRDGRERIRSRDGRRQDKRRSSSSASDTKKDDRKKKEYRSSSSDDKKTGQRLSSTERKALSRLQETFDMREYYDTHNEWETLLEKKRREKREKERSTHRSSSAERRGSPTKKRAASSSESDSDADHRKKYADKGKEKGDRSKRSDKDPYFVSSSSSEEEDNSKTGRSGSAKKDRDDRKSPLRGDPNWTPGRRRRAEREDAKRRNRHADGSSSSDEDEERRKSSGRPRSRGEDPETDEAQWKLLSKNHRTAARAYKERERRFRESPQRIPTPQRPGRHSGTDDDRDFRASARRSGGDHSTAGYAESYRDGGRSSYVSSKRYDDGASRLQGQGSASLSYRSSREEPLGSSRLLDSKVADRDQVSSVSVLASPYPIKHRTAEERRELEREDRRRELTDDQYGSTAADRDRSYRGGAAADQVKTQGRDSILMSPIRGGGGVGESGREATGVVANTTTSRSFGENRPLSVGERLIPASELQGRAPNDSASAVRGGAGVGEDRWTEDEEELAQQLKRSQQSSSQVYALGVHYAPQKR
jgi:hypothetical protein